MYSLPTDVIYSHLQVFAVATDVTPSSGVRLRVCVFVLVCVVINCGTNIDHFVSGNIQSTPRTLPPCVFATRS